MNGQYSIKGYLYQSLVALLDSFKTDWESVCVEPNDESEKVDIRWNYSDGRIVVVQVKSSINNFTPSAIKKWARELSDSTPNASEYRLILIGNVAGNVGDKIEDVLVERKNMSIDDYQSIIMQKINSFYECNGKSLISTKLCQLFVRALNHKVLEDSIIGKVLYREEFKNGLMANFDAIEGHLKNNPLSLLLPENSEPNKDVKTCVIDNVLKLLGWKNMTKHETQSIYNERLGKDVICTLDYWGDHESPLKDKGKDILYINADIDADYSSSLQNHMKNKLFAFEQVRGKLLNENRISVNNAYEYNINFILSLANNDQGKGIANTIDLFKTSSLSKDVMYYLVDNQKLDFLISSIVTAKSYRPNLPVKFLYPITEDNSEIRKIGRRGSFMPPQFLNSSILPIIKEDIDKISVLMFCSDRFSKEHLRKTIWLLMRLTSGLANEYILYFPDYNQSYESVVNEVIRSYGNDDLNLRVEQIKCIGVDSLKFLPSYYNDISSSASYDESKNQHHRIQPHLIEYLPYGDSMRPFLASDAVKAVDLKAFLSNKGIFFKSADKTKLIQLMTGMLFSSNDIETLVDFVNVNEKPLSTTSKQYQIFDDVDTKYLLDIIPDNFSVNSLQNNLKGRVVSYEKFRNDNGSVTIKAHIEEVNPNKQALVNVTNSVAQVTISIDEASKSLEFTKEYNSRPARLFSERLTDEISRGLIQRYIIEDKANEVLFSHFSNLERANYLLSFTNIESSSIFVDFNAKSFKYMFDENAELPQEYADKKGKECITHLKGKNLDSIRELQDEELKSIILCEEISINYKFKIRGVTGSFFVMINFSDALKNKPIPDGLLNYNYKCYINRNCKERVQNVKSLEKELRIEFNRLVKEKLNLFNKM